MPLRDHFHSPVDDKHRWDSLHGQWPAMIVLDVFSKLPPEFVALPTVHLGGSVEIDIGAFEYVERDQAPRRDWHPNDSGDGGTATLTQTQPSLSVETDRPDADEYEVRIYDSKRQSKLVAAIEIVSPSNKDRPETRRAFVDKCAALLRQDVSVAIVDLVTPYNFNLYADLLERLGTADPTVADSPSGIYAMSCRGYTAPQALGLPSLAPSDDPRPPIAFPAHLAARRRRGDAGFGNHLRTNLPGLPHRLNRFFHRDPLCRHSPNSPRCSITRCSNPSSRMPNSSAG